MINRLTIGMALTAMLALSPMGAYAQAQTSNPEPVSQTNQGKGTPEAADPSTSTTQEVVDGALNRDRDLSDKDGTFDNINQPQEEVTTNKGKGTSELAEFEANRDRYYERLDHHTAHRYTLDGDVNQGDRDITSRTNQGKGTTNRANADLYSLDADYRDSDRHWRQTDMFWRSPERQRDSGAQDYWERSNAYWQDSESYWRDSGRYHNEQMKSRTNQGVGTTGAPDQVQ